MFEFDIIPLHLIPWLLLISVLSWASLLALNSGYNEWVNKLSIVGLFAMFPFVLSFALICKQVLCCKHCLQFKSNYGIGSIEMHFVCYNFQYVSFEIPLLPMVLNLLIKFVDCNTREWVWLLRDKKRLQAHDTFLNFFSVIEITLSWNLSSLDLSKLSFATT